MKVVKNIVAAILSLSLWLAVSVLLSSKTRSKNIFTTDQKNAFRREMIEFDIETRNLASAISMGDRQYVLRTLRKLKTSQVGLAPRYRKSIREVYTILRSEGNFRYLKNIRLELNVLYKELIKHPKKFTDSQWGLVRKKFSVMLKNCRFCHEKMIE